MYFLKTLAAQKPAVYWVVFAAVIVLAGVNKPAPRRAPFFIPAPYKS